MPFPCTFVHRQRFTNWNELKRHILPSPTPCAPPFRPPSSPKLLLCPAIHLSRQGKTSATQVSATTSPPDYVVAPLWGAQRAKQLAACKLAAPWLDPSVTDQASTMSLPSQEQPERPHDGRRQHLGYQEHMLRRGRGVRIAVIRPRKLRRGGR